MFWSDNISFYISIVSGFLLTISEMLPYINSIQSNGILQLVTDNLIKRSQNGGNRGGGGRVEDDSSRSDEENTPLLTQEYSVTSKVSNVIINSPNVTFTFDSTNVRLEFNASDIKNQSQSENTD